MPPDLVDLELEQRDALVQQLEPDRRLDVGGPVGHVAGHVAEGRSHGRRAIGAQEVESVGEQFEGAGDGHDRGNERSARLVPGPPGVVGRLPTKNLIRSERFCAVAGHGLAWGWALFPGPPDCPPD